MRLTAYTDFSLRVLTYLGLRGDRLATIHEIATAYGVSQNHLMKVVHQLGRAGIVETVRGRGGGIRLARAPAAIRVGDVIRRMEDDFQIVACFAGNDGSSRGGGCVIAPDCRLAGMLDEALHAFLAVLDGYTLADLLAAPDRLGRHFPALAPDRDATQAAGREAAPARA